MKSERTNFPASEFVPLFTEIPTERKSISKNNNILKKIVSNSRNIKKLLKQTVAGTKLYRIGNRKPTPLLNLEKGLKDHYFCLGGSICEECPILKKSILQNNRRKKLKLNEKIDMGKLTFYFLKGENPLNKETKNENIIKTKTFVHSHNYSTNLNNKDINIVEFKKLKEMKINHRKIDSEQLFNRLFTQFPKSKPKNLKLTLSENFNNNLAQNLTENKKKQKKKSPKTKRRLNVIVPRLQQLEDSKIHCETTRENQRLFSSYDFDYSSNPNIKNFRNELEKKNYLHNKATASVISQKINFMGETQDKLERKLFKIIDNSSYLQPLPMEFKKDVEAIMGVKLKNKRKKGQIKKDVNVIRIEGDYSSFKKKDRNIIKLGDQISYLNDQIVNINNEDIKKNYWKKTKNKLTKIQETIDNLNDENKLKLREKINKNNLIMKKMRVNLDFFKNSLKY